MSVLLFISILIFALYIEGVLIKFGIPVSISDAHYLTIETNKRLNFLFPTFCIGLSATLLPIWLTISEGQWFQFTAFFAVGALIFVGASPLFKIKEIGKVHYAAATISVIASQLWIILSGLWYVPVICFALCGFTTYKFGLRYWMFWVEIAAFIGIYIYQ